MDRKMWSMISNLFSPLDPVPPSLLDAWFVERPDQTLDYLVSLLSPEKLPGQHILVGQLASGKSSELTKLASELQKQYDAMVIRFDMTDNIADTERANPVDVIFLMGAAIFKAASADLPAHRQPDRQLLENLKSGLESLVQTHTDNKKFEVNLDKLLAGLIVFGGAALAGPIGAAAGLTISSNTSKTVQTLAQKLMPFRFISGTNTQVVRRLEVEPDVEGMIDGLNAIIDDVRLQAEQPLILLVDGLDKLRDPDLISLNFLENNFLNGPNCSVLYTGPLDLYYSPQFGEVRSRFLVVPYPHVKLYDRHNPNAVDHGAYDLMRQVVYRRLQAEQFEPEAIIALDVLDLLIQGSGGVMRDLIRLMQINTFAKRDVRQGG